MKICTQIYLMTLLVIAPVWLLACGNNGNGNKADGSDIEATIGEKEGDFSGAEDVEHSEITDNETEALAQGINIGIKSITMPEHPRGDYVPFSSCPQEKVTKFEFRVENRGSDFNRSGKGIYGSVQIKRLSDGAVFLKEEAVYEFRAFTPGWVRFRFDPIDLSQAGLYEVTVESYLIDLVAYRKDRSLQPLDADLSDNKVVYLRRVSDLAALPADKPHLFDFKGVQSVMDLAQQGWNYSFLPDSLRISEKGIGGSKAIEMHLHKGDKNKRKLFTPPVAVTQGLRLDLQFKLLDAQSGKNVTEELMASEAFKALFSLQEICSTGVTVTYTHKVAMAEPKEDGFFAFPDVLADHDPGNFRGQIEFANLSPYPEILLVIDQVSIEPK